MMSSASSIPALRRRSASVPSPTRKLPLKSWLSASRAAARLKEPGSRSTMVTSCPSSSSSLASREPTRPQPTISTFTMPHSRVAPQRLDTIVSNVRFPFTLMGILSLLLGVWIMVYFLIRKPDGPVSGGIEVATAFVMIAFGSWVVWRRLTGRERA